MVHSKLKKRIQLELSVCASDEGYEILVEVLIG